MSNPAQRYKKFGLRIAFRRIITIFAPRKPLEVSITPTPSRPSHNHHSMPEAKIQAECFAWFWNTFPEFRGLFFAVPNQNDRSANEDAKQRAISGARRRMIGVVAGVSDSVGLIPSSNYHGFCAECKTPTGRQSDVQKIWQEKVTKQRYYYFVYRSLDEFKAELRRYFNGEA